MEFLAAAQKLWRHLNLRVMIVMSLFLQVILIFVAPIRKRRSNWLIMILTWAAYLVADWVADYAFGLIAKAQFNGAEYEDVVYGDLLAFWAPFLLLHLGGPDTITAFALEDNELWRRHLLNLFFQLGAAGYVLYQSLPNDKLIVPTILVFIGGIIKYIERTRALYLGSTRKFRGSFLTSGDAGPNYAKLMEEHSSKKNANIPVSIEMMPEPDMESNGEENKTNEGTQSSELDDRVVVFKYFSTFKGLLVDLIFSFRERNESMKFFKRMEAKDAFHVIEAELNFFYDVLYTKAAVVHCSTGYLFRAISIGSIITAFVFFYVLNKHGFHEYDIQITYALLLGAVGLEFVALSMLIFSDWTIALLGRLDKPTIRTFIEFLLKFKPKEGSLFALPILHDRWSKSIHQYNLIDSRLRRWPKWIEKFLDYISLGELFDDLKSGRQVPYSDELGELIFDELKRKSQVTDDSKHIKEMCAARGKWALENIEKEGENFKASLPNLLRDLLPFVHEVDYGESLLLWHIATKLCDNRDEIDESANPDTDESAKPDTCRANSKILSDYMLYLMIKQPDMMSVVAGIGQIRFRDTCAEVDKFMDENIFDGSKADGKIFDWGKAKEIICSIFDRSKRKKRKQIVSERKKRKCESLLSVPTNVKPVDVKGDRSKSALFDACILAKVLLKIEKENRWKIMSRVWVELLGYAAIHCRPYNHAQQLSKGGELITLVWLLMVQLGLSEQFQIVEGHARAKLIVQK